RARAPWDPPRPAPHWPAGGGATAGGEPEAGPDEGACRHLRGDDAAAPRSDEQGRPDGAVADLRRYRHRPEQGGEEPAEQLPRVEHLELVRLAPELVGAEAVDVQDDSDRDQPEQGCEQRERGPGRALLEQLGAQGGTHRRLPAVSSR